MLKKYKVVWLILLVFVLEALIYARATATIDSVGVVFTECARNSGRLSALLNLIILVMVGYWGLKRIYANQKMRDAFRILLVMFAVNHIIHFYFFTQNFKHQFITVDILHNMHGFITYIFIAILPLVLWRLQALGQFLYFVVIIHLFNVTYMIADTFYGRVKPVDPAYLHQIGIGVMILALFYILYRTVKEQNVNN